MNRRQILTTIIPAAVAGAATGAAVAALADQGADQELFDLIDEYRAAHRAFVAAEGWREAPGGHDEVGWITVDILSYEPAGMAGALALLAMVGEMSRCAHERYGPIRVSEYSPTCIEMPAINAEKALRRLLPI